MADPVMTTAVFWDLKASDLLKFSAELVSAIAWPVAAAFIVGFFKKEIIERIPKLAELTLPGGFAAKFNDVLTKAEASVPEKLQPAANSDTEVLQVQDESPRYSIASGDAVPAADQLALRANPTGVVMEAWKILESTLRIAATAMIGEGVAQRPAPNVVASLRNANLLSREEEDSLLELIELRNVVAHTPNKTVSQLEAKRFADIAARFNQKFTSTLMNKAWADARHTSKYSNRMG